MIKTIIGFAVLLAVVTVPARAQQFPPKPEILDQIKINLIGERILRARPPRAQTTTITTGSPYNSISTTFDSTPPMPPQDLRVANGSIYDVKNVVVECAYLGESGAVLSVKTQMLPYRFDTARIRTVSLRDPPTGTEATGISCVAKDFDFIGVGTPPRPERNDPSPSIANAKPWVDEWGGPPRPVQSGPLVDEWGARKGH